MTFDTAALSPWCGSNNVCMFVTKKRFINCKTFYYLDKYCVSKVDKSSVQFQFDIIQD